MTGYDYNDATRSLRGPEREAMLLQEAERLIEARARRLHVSPRALVNQIFRDEPDAAPTKAEVERDSVVNTLRERLAVRDRGSDAD